MNIDEFRQKMESDATKENEHLRSCEELKKLLTDDCQALANRCFVLTKGSMCCFCELNEFRCPHAWSYDRKIKAAMKFMEERS